MKKIIVAALAVVLLPVNAAVAVQHKAAANSLPAPVVAVVDVQRILQESLAAKSVQKQLEGQRAKVQAEVAGEEKKLRQAEQALVKSRNVDAPDVYAEKEQGLRQQFLEVERQVQSRRKALEQAFTDSMNVVRKSLLDNVNDLAKERGANIVIVKQQTLWTDKTVDITDATLARLDKALPRVHVKFSADGGQDNVSSPRAPSLLKKKIQ
jgi:Skp family chaperone for outer membrane proteins